MPRHHAQLLQLPMLGTSPSDHILNILYVAELIGGKRAGGRRRGWEGFALSPPPCLLGEIQRLRISWQRDSWRLSGT